MHYSARTQTAGRALSEVLRSHTHKHTLAHTSVHADRMREQSGHLNHRQNTESVHTCFLSHKGTHTPAHTNTKRNTLIYSFDSTGSMNSQQMCSLITISWFLVVSILHSPPDQIPLAYRKGNNSWCWCIIRACYVYVYRGRHWDLCFQEESNSRWCHSIAGMMTPESWRGDPRVG